MRKQTIFSDDFTFPTAKRQKAERLLAQRAKDDKRGVEYEFQDYKGMHLNTWFSWLS